MKTEEEIKKQLKDIYTHRLNLRIERKMKRSCRNCKSGVCNEFDLGDFGMFSKWQCKDNKKCNENCGFECLYNAQEIEGEMIKDISDPSICGAKEPKIAVLLWILHNGKAEEEKPEKENSLISFMKRLFK